MSKTQEVMHVKIDRKNLLKKLKKHKDRKSARRLHIKPTSTSSHDLVLSLSLYKSLDISIVIQIHPYVEQTGYCLTHVVYT